MTAAAGPPGGPLESGYARRGATGGPLLPTIPPSHRGPHSCRALRRWSSGPAGPGGRRRRVASGSCDQQAGPRQQGLRGHRGPRSPRSPARSRREGRQSGGTSLSLDTAAADTEGLAGAQGRTAAAERGRAGLQLQQETPGVTLPGRQDPGTGSRDSGGAPVAPCPVRDGKLGGWATEGISARGQPQRQAAGQAANAADPAQQGAPTSAPSPRYNIPLGPGRARGGRGAAPQGAAGGRGSGPPQ